jgi:2-polyprenyl-3-methyl-5-hydroxy-6-metoxy-1,4-benzoquinol methylase
LKDEGLGMKDKGLGMKDTGLGMKDASLIPHLSSLISHPSSLIPHPSSLISDRLSRLDDIYTSDWKRRIRDYFSHGAQFASASGYWAFDFERQWAKHRKAVARELRLVERIGRWMSPVGRRVLVMGSWLGAEAIAYALCGAEVTAIDLDAEALRLSAELAARYGTSIKTAVIDASATGLPAEHFDLVSCSQVLEHLPPDRQPALVAEMWRLCRPDGLLWLDTPNQLALCDQHDTGLYFVHWLPRPLKTRLARWLRRDVPTSEPGFGFQAVGLHYFISYFGLMRILRGLGPLEVLSRYRGFANVAHYAVCRRNEGRAGPLFPLKLAALRAAMAVWNFNWMHDIRLVVRKK